MRTKLREMLPADVPKVLEKLHEQNERDGTSYAMPQVFDRQGRRMARIPLALVACDVETGEVVQGHVWEQTVEHMTFGTSPEATVCSMHEQDAVFYLLRERGYRDEHILVPPNRVADMAHGLDSILRMTDTGMRHFYRLLDPAENESMRNWYQDQEKEKCPEASKVKPMTPHPVKTPPTTRTRTKLSMPRNRTSATTGPQ